LFTDLDKMDTGDVFMMHILDETLTYQVDQILIVLPHEVEALAIEEEKDYCTLVTCTPYGVNSHRLLVRGSRVEQVQQTIGPAAVPSVSVEGVWWFAMISPLVMGIAVAAALILRLRRR
jgi:sortase A